MRISVRSFILQDNCIDTGCSLKIFDKNIFLKFESFDGMHRFIPALFKAYNKKAFYINVNHFERKFGKSKYGTFDRLSNGIKNLYKVKKILNKKLND